jgi:hypothetical protein
MGSRVSETEIMYFQGCMIEAPSAPPVPVRRVESGAGSGGKEPKASTPRWVVVAVIIALLLGVTAIAMGFLSGGSDSGGNAPPTTAQVSASSVSSADLAALQARLDGYAADLSHVQQVVQAQSAVVQEQSATIASLQAQLNTTVTPTIQPTTAPPTPAPTDPPTTAPTTTTTAPSMIANIPEVVTSAQRLGLLLPNGSWVGPAIGLSYSDLDLFDHIVEIDGDLSLGSTSAAPWSFPFLRTVRGTLFIHNVWSGLTSFRFTVLHTVGSLTITRTGPLVTLNGTFPSLRVVEATLSVFLNDGLTTLDGAFPAIQSVGDQLLIRDNSNLADIGTTFNQLTSIGAGRTGMLNVYDNAPGFCLNYSSRLCPTTTTLAGNGDDGARDCCTTFCSTSALC